MVLVNQEFFKHLYHFNRTIFELDLQNKDFIKKVINYGKSLIAPIYENSTLDINFASAIISTGINFDPSELLFGLYHRDKTTLKTHINNIKNYISKTDYQASNNILDAMYSDKYIKYYNSSKCFYPPAIIVNATKTNNPIHGIKVYELYKNLYEDGSIVIKDILDVIALITLTSFNVSFIAPTINNNALKHALYYITEDKSKVACLLPFGKFDSSEIGRSLHELTHTSMGYIFKNNANPYPPLNNSHENYNYAAKQMISNITALMGVSLDKLGLEHKNYTSIHFKYDLIKNEDILLHLAIHRLDEPKILNHIFRILFNDHSISTESITKYIKALYKAEIITKNISNTAVKIALERIGDWAIYPNAELDKESIARFVELHYIFKELNYSQDALESMMIYWKDNISPKVIEFKESLGLEECCNWDIQFDYSGYII